MTSIPRRHLKVGLLLGLSLSMVACGDTGGEDLEHGSVKVRFRRAPNVDVDPFVGTVNVEITLDYLDCIIDFYNRNPDYTQQGAVGLPAFGTEDQGGEGWADRLCDGSEAEQAPCNVVSIEQQLDMNPHLTIIYEMTGDLENRFVNFGPLPTDELAACEGLGQPIVRVASNGDVRGLTGSGETLWEAVSFDPDKAATNQGQAMEIRCGPRD